MSLEKKRALESIEVYLNRAKEAMQKAKELADEHGLVLEVFGKDSEQYRVPREPAEDNTTSPNNYNYWNSSGDGPGC